MVLNSTSVFFKFTLYNLHLSFFLLLQFFTKVLLLLLFLLGLFFIAFPSKTRIIASLLQRDGERGVGASRGGARRADGADASQDHQDSSKVSVFSSPHFVVAITVYYTIYLL